MCNQAGHGGERVRLELSGASFDAQALAPEDAWIEKLDHEAFKADVKALGNALAEQQGPEDMVGDARAIKTLNSAAMTSADAFSPDCRQH